MSPRITKFAVVALVALVMVIAVRHHFSAGEVVKRKIGATIEAFEEERLLPVMSSISRGYSDPLGLDYEILGGYLKRAMEDYDDLDVDYVLTRPSVAEDEVRVGIEFVIWGRLEGTRGPVVGTRGSVLGSVSEPCSALLLWRKEAPGWRLASTVDLDIPEYREELDSRRQGQF
ncbi:MAG: hypothetical protein P8127_13805 [Acidobacteriota bacterium]|jgi:hypothetical protein